MAQQEVFTAEDGYPALERFFLQTGAAHIFLVCGRSICRLALDAFFQALPRRTGIRVTRFSGFQPNPQYDSVVEAVRQFREEECSLVVAVGGGSAIDVAKCVKLYAELDPSRCYLEQEPAPNGIRLLAVPTTAGSGSEATRFSVLYRNNRKLSITHDMCMPDAVLLDPAVLDSLPEYQRKSTMLDALCHALESFWCVHATEQSRGYAGQAIKDIFSNLEGYLQNTAQGNAGMQQAAYAAGRAINITQTTAGHAMCYQLTSRYGIAHGHAAALCVSVLWPDMLQRMDSGAETENLQRLRGALQGIAVAMGCGTPEQAAVRFQRLLGELRLGVPPIPREEIAALTETVAPERLRNHPIRLDSAAIESLYCKIAGFQQ